MQSSKLVKSIGRYKIYKEFRQNLFLGKYMIVINNRVCRHVDTIKEATAWINKKR